MKYIYIVITCCILLTACSKKMDLAAPDGLSISLDASRLKGDTYFYKVGDTAKFVMAGNADQIIFYSGEATRNYSNANRTTAAGNPILAFTSAATLGTQTNTLQVLATNKLPKLDAASILNANWTDVTSRGKLSVGSGAVASGSIDLGDIINGTADSLFIAFKYSGTTGSIQRTWTITNLTVNSILADGTSTPAITLAADASYWTRVKSIGSSADWTASTTQLQVIGGSATAPSNTSWIVSKPIYPGRVNPDAAIVVKQLASEIPLYTIAGKTYKGYNYQYTKPGTYTATMIVYNNNIDGQKTAIKQFNIKVE